MGTSDSTPSFGKLMKMLDDVRGQQSVTYEELFPDSFMSQYTEFDSIEQFCDRAPYKIWEDQGLDDLPETELDEFVQNHTEFSSWNDMKQTSAKLWGLRQLDLD